MITDTIKETVTTYVKKGRELVSGAFEVVSERLHLRNGANGHAGEGAQTAEAAPVEARAATTPAPKASAKVKETSKTGPAPAKMKEKKLADMTRAELYAVATELGVRGRKNMRKTQLIDSIKEYRKK